MGNIKWGYVVFVVYGDCLIVVVFVIINWNDVVIVCVIVMIVIKDFVEFFFVCVLVDFSMFYVGVMVGIIYVVFKYLFRMCGWYNVIVVIDYLVILFS